MKPQLEPLRLVPSLDDVPSGVITDEERRVISGRLMATPVPFRVLGRSLGISLTAAANRFNSGVLKANKWHANPTDELRGLPPAALRFCSILNIHTRAEVVEALTDERMHPDKPMKRARGYGLRAHELTLAWSGITAKPVERLKVVGHALRAGVAQCEQELRDMGPIYSPTPRWNRLTAVRKALVDALDLWGIEVATQKPQPGQKRLPLP